MDLAMVSGMLLGGVFLAGALMIGLHVRYTGALKRAARELGLRWTSRGALDPGEIEGDLDGEHVRVYTRPDADGDVRATVLTVDVTFPEPFPVAFSAAEESVLSRLGHALGLGDVELGDPEFDRRFKVKGDDPDALRLLFNASARLALLALARTASDVHVTPKRLRWWHAGRVYDAHALAREVRQGVVAAKAMRLAHDP